MPSPKLVILNMPEADSLAAMRQAPKFLQPIDFSLHPCAGCTGNCCQLDVHLTTVEVMRLVTALRLPVLDVVEVRPVSPAREPPWYTVPIPLDGGAVTLGLRRLKTRNCIFLHSINGRGRCVAHAVRPGICRAYPFDALYEESRITAGSQLLCPTRWLQDDDTRASLKKNLDGWHRDLAQERKLLAGWEKHPASPRDFSAFFAFAFDGLAEFLGIDRASFIDPPRKRLGPRLW